MATGQIGGVRVTSGVKGQVGGLRLTGVVKTATGQVGGVRVTGAPPITAWGQVGGVQVSGVGTAAKGQVGGVRVAGSSNLTARGQVGGIVVSGPSRFGARGQVGGLRVSGALPASTSQGGLFRYVGGRVVRPSLLRFKGNRVLDLSDFNDATSSPMPTTAPAGFVMVYGEDFNDRGDGVGSVFPEGAFTVGGAGQVSDGRLLSSSPAYVRYGPVVNLFPDGYPDTNAYAYNWPSKTISTRNDVPDANGVMQIRLRTETINGTPTALTAAVRPVIAGETQQEQSYGRLSMRIKADPVTGYGAVMLMIANGTISGEIDWFEGGLAQAIHGYFHGTDGSRTDITTATPAYLSDWHVFTTERTPTAIRLYLDGVLVRTITAQMSTALMKNVLQVGGDSGTPPVGSSGLVLVDWITFARWTG